MEKRYALLVVGFANGAPCPIAGQFVQTFDFAAENGRGYGTFTANASEAMKFADQGEALEFWKTQSKTAPLRPDGQPNRPLTSTTVQIIQV